MGMGVALGTHSIVGGWSYGDGPSDFSHWGAGYTGSHACKALFGVELTPVVYIA
jgi:hypothetical protein